MIRILTSILLPFAFALPPEQGPTPIFLKEGYSSILDFDDAPTQVVIGDSNSFQVERLRKSIVLKPLVPYSTTNLFVYFKDKPTKLFILSASEDSQPTLLRKFETVKPTPLPGSRAPLERQAFVKKATFDKNKDYLTVDVLLSADSNRKIIPDWNLIRLRYKESSLSPSKVWSERKEIQKDSSLRARFIFTKPNIPRDLAKTSITIPILGETNPIQLVLSGGTR